MKKFSLMVIGTMLLGSSAFADGDGARLGLDELKAKCRELSDNPQIQPFNVRITCREKAHVWKPGTPSSVTLQNHREVGATLAMKNFNVSYQGGNADIVQTQAACSTLEKWEHTVQAVDVELSCAELYEVADVSAFCAPVIDQRVQEDSSIVTMVKSDQVYDTCRGQSQVR
jgi:hypothetical protein